MPSLVVRAGALGSAVQVMKETGVRAEYRCAFQRRVVRAASSRRPPVALLDHLREHGDRNLGRGAAAQV